MGLNVKSLLRAGSLASLAIAGLFAISSTPASAQPSPPAGGQGGGGTGTAYVYSTVSNSYLTLYAGAGSSVAGSLGIWSNASNFIDPGNALMYGGPIQPSDSPVTVPYFGGWLYLRIDDGTTGTLNGKDYLFGDPANGGWLASPTLVGSHLEAIWVTKAFASGPGTTSSSTKTEIVEIDMVASFVHDTVRFSFNAKNLGKSPHKIGLAFVQDIGVQTNTLDMDGPLRLTNAPYLHTESLLTGGQIPASWYTSVPISAATATAPAKYHSIKGILLPPNSSVTEPSAPSRFAYGRTAILEGSDYSTGTKVRNFDWLWNFATYMDPTVVLDQNVGLNTTDASTVVYWDQQEVPAQSGITKVAYLGSDTSDQSVIWPAALSVSAPPALGFSSSTTPQTFTIGAFIQNLTDLPNPATNTSASLSFSTVNFTLDLPKGLILVGNDTLNKSLSSSLASGAEGTVSWNVQQDPTNPVSGTLTFAVTATTNYTTQVVQRNIQVPSPSTITLDPDVMHPGYFKMLSFAQQFNNATPSQILGLPSGNNVTPQIDSRQWNPLTGTYIEQPNWVPGSAYWVKYSPGGTAVTTPVTFQVSAALYPALDQQVLPTASSYKVNYLKGWNQIGDPYVYNYRFSEMQVFNPTTLAVTDIVSASDNLHQWLLPAVYFYNTSDPNPANWFYQLEDNLGFDMLTNQGYWIYVLQDNLQFIYNGVDTPAGSVSRAAQVGVGLGTTLGAGTANNWRLQLTAKTAHGTDSLSYVGVAPAATNSKDIYKYPKPPTFNPGISLNIVHTDWPTGNGVYAQDLRAPGSTSQVWNMQVTANAADREVVLTWPGASSSVPRNYDLYLVDPTTGVQQNIKNTSTYSLSVSGATTRSFQIVATPRTRTSTAITSVAVVPNSGRGAGAPTSATINYQLTGAADTQVNIRNSRGAIIRTINGTTRAATDNSGVTTGQVLWDLRDSKGTSLSTGAYTVEIVATTVAGQRTRQTTPYIITR
jgi:hypothetical protein